MKMKRLLVAVLAICMLATGMIGNLNVAQADVTQYVVAADNNTSFVLKPGETTHIKLKVKATIYFLYELTVKISDENENSPFTYSRPVFTNGSGETITSFGTSMEPYVEFDVTVKETAGIKSYPISLLIDGTNFFESTFSSKIDLKLNIFEEKAPIQLTINTVRYDDNTIGNDMNISFYIKNEGELIARNTYINVTYGETGIAKNYTVDSIKFGDINPGESKPFTLPVKILPNATPGNKTLTINFSYKDVDGTAKNSAYSIQVDVEENSDVPQLDIERISYPDNVKPGDEFILKAVFRNNGESKAKDIRVTVENTEADSIVKNYFSDYIKVSSLDKGDAKEAEIPLIAGAGANGNLNKLSLKITYSDALDVAYTKTKTLYLAVASDSEVPGKETSIVIKNVSQNPAMPVAGGDLKVTFAMENKGNADIKELKLELVGLTGNTFIPVNTEPYIFIELLKAGETKSISIPLKVSDDIPEGLNYLEVKYSYKGGAGDTVKLPILDVQNALGSSSIPKLIISNYGADVEELRAGNTFNFTFDLYNTHSSVTAKNITVTILKSTGSAGDVFTPTKGSNSFFIESIAPGETVQKTLEMKVKSDTKTGAYELNIEVEYEFDGYKPKENSDKGYTRSNILTLQAIENARPVVDYVNVYSYDGNVAIGNPAFLSFEFYNMGRSALNNVVATVEGDFMKADGNMYFVGNVMEGSSMYVEFEVLPNIEGMAKGTLRITYEDSNGDKVDYLKEFETMVNGMPIFDPNMGGDGGVDVFNPTMPQPKKEILKPWLFIIIQIVLFLVFIPVTRKAIITVYRKKLQKKEESKY